MKNLVVYFSATGTTKNAAEKVANLINAEIFEIKPKEKYSSEDLNWNDKNSRTTYEKEHLDFRPEIVDKVNNINEYDNVLIFFPIWWYKAPNIIYSFIDSYDLTNKTLIPFVTSGSSTIDSTYNHLVEDYPSLIFKKGLRISGNITLDELNNIIN